MPHIVLFAAKELEVGEELRYDYGGGDLPWRINSNWVSENNESTQHKEDIVIEPVEDLVIVNEPLKDPVKFVNESVEDPIMVNECVEDLVVVNDSVEDPVMVNECVVEDPVIVNESVEDSVMVNESVEDPVIVNESVKDPVIVNESVEDPVIVNESVEDPVIVETKDEEIVKDVSKNEEIENQSSDLFDSEDEMIKTNNHIKNFTFTALQYLVLNYDSDVESNDSTPSVENSNRLESSLESERIAQDSALARIGKYRLKIPEDGNCLFRAVGSQLPIGQVGHLHLRKETSAWLEQNTVDMIDGVSTRDEHAIEHWSQEGKVGILEIDS